MIYLPLYKVYMIVKKKYKKKNQFFFSVFFFFIFWRAKKIDIIFFIKTIKNVQVNQFMIFLIKNFNKGKQICLILEQKKKIVILKTKHKKFFPFPVLDSNNYEYWSF